MPTILSAPPELIAQTLFASSTTAEAALGSLAYSEDGRKFRYCKMGAVAGVPGKLYQAPAEVTADQNLACAAAAIAATSVTTTSTVTVTANQYAGGWLTVGVTPGEGYQYKISSHKAATAATVVLNLEDPIIVALTTSSRVDLVANPYGAVVVNPTTATSAPVGVAVFAIPISEFGWLQVGGIANLLADGTITVGTEIVASNGTAGAVEPVNGVLAPIGTALSGIATTEYGPINLLLV